MAKQIEIFKEKQPFDKPILKFVFVGGFILFAYGYIQQVYFGKPFGSEEGASNDGLMWGAIISLILTVAIQIAKLETKIDNSGIKFRFFPFHIRWRSYSWSDLKQIKVRHFEPFDEFGGYGLRSRKGVWSFAVEGKYCIELFKQDGRRTVIGTCNTEEARKTIKHFAGSKVKK